MEKEVLTPSELRSRLQSLYSVIDEGLDLGIRFQSLEEAAAAYCEPDFIEPDYFGCETFAEVAELLLANYRHLEDYPYC
jgi:hypothetical protein